MNISDIYKQLPLIYQQKPTRTELILTGSWQYGTNTDESDLDLVLIHNLNMEMDVINVDNNKDETFVPSNFERQYTGNVFFYGAQREIDVRLLSYTTFIRKLYSGDINCVEYISSPYYMRPSPFLDKVVDKFLYYSLPAPYYKYKVLKSLLGFLNPINRKKSKKFIIPEQVNQNNLIKIANLFYLIKYERYPLNPDMAMSLMIDADGNKVDLIDATSPYHNSTEIISYVLEKYKTYLEERYPKKITSECLDGARQYRLLLRELYLGQ